jgi:replicative DNA helicase
MNAAYADAERLRIPPNSIQAEQSVLGGLMLDNQTWDAVMDRVGEEDFYHKDHRLIFRGIKQLAEKQMPFDVVTLSEILEKFGWLDEAGGLAYLATLAKETPSAANIAAYADIVREKSVLRQLIHAGTEIFDAGFHPESRDLSRLLEDAEQKVFQIAEQRAKGRAEWVSMSETLSRSINAVESANSRGTHLIGIPTGLEAFDEATCGLGRGDLIIIAGRPSMGKSALGAQFAQHAAMAGDLVAVFSMEMPVEQLGIRMLGSVGHIDNMKLKTGDLADDEWPRLTSAINILAKTKMFIEPTAALSPFEVRARCRRLARAEGKIGMVLLDYLQLMTVPGLERDPVQAVTACSAALKALAKELDCPVIALSQLNRELEKRPNKRPVMSDLRQSGAVEQDADLIVAIYRDEVYYMNQPTLSSSIWSVIDLPQGDVVA